MSKGLLGLATLAASLLFAAAADAQYAPAPTSYTVVSEAGGETLHIYRDGNKAMVDMSMPKSADQPVAIHTRTLIDISAHQDVTWDLNDPKAPCGKGSSPDWNDPFAQYDQFMQSASGQPKKIGQEKVNELDTTVFDIPSKEAAGKMWRDDKYGMVVKFTAAPPGQKPMTMVEVKELKLGKPDASVFAVPARCGK